MAFLTRRRKYIARNCSALKRWGIISWAGLSYIVHRVERKFSISKGIVTFAAFSIFLLIVPLFALSFVVLGIYREGIKLWISWQENGEIEVANVAFRSAMETSEQAAIFTYVFSVEGKLHENHIRIWLTEMINQENSTFGSTDHQNFKKQLIRIKGYFAWINDSKFSLDNHITTGASHHHGTTLTERNIQEYISELCSNPLPPGQSPWEVKITHGVTEIGEPTTWIVFRAHHLLANNMRLPGFPSSLPNPWESGSFNKAYSVLEAPNAIKRLYILVRMSLFYSIFNIVMLFFTPINKMIDKFHRVDIKSLSKILKNSLHSAFHSVKKCYYIIFITVNHRTYKIKEPKSLVILALQTSSLFIIQIVVNLTEKTYRFYTCIRNVFAWMADVLRDTFKTPNFYVNLCIDAILELYWIARALISLPRLMMEEMFASHSTVPLHIWRRKGLKHWKRVLVSWSEEVPLQRAEEIQGLTGATLSSVLLTALSGAIRDIVRYSGVQPPEYLRCTLPVHIPYDYGKSLLPFSLPTRSSYGQKTLREVCKNIDRMLKYPETYLASVWLIKHAPKFLPEIILKRILIFLTTCHPILLTNLVGPSSATYLWGSKLRSVFYWRPPQHDAAISVCISSYCGRVSLGVLADGWTVPHANILPQSFASHLNELAVETGVKLQRQNSKVWSRRSSPRSSPSPSPPLTPNIFKGWTPFSQYTLYALFQKRTKSCYFLETTRKNRENLEFCDNQR